MELEIVFLVFILLVGGYFLVFEHGITGALTGLSEATVDSQVLEMLEKGKEVSVVVMLRDDPKNDESLDKKKEKISQTQKKVLNYLDLEDSSVLGIKQEQEFNLEKKYETVNAFSGKVTKDGLKKLQKDYHVAQIKYDSPIHILLSESGPLVKSNVTNSFGFDGQGQTVCVVDTGVDYTHPALGNCTTNDFLNGTCSKVIAGVDIADNDNDPIDLNGHGSHVAGIVASTDGTYKGIAPGTTIAGVKVFPGSSGGTNLSNVIGGLDWCVNNSVKYNISIITLSLGDGGNYNEYCDSHPLSVVVNNAVSSGIFVDVASGNNGYTNGINAPACASGVAAVGATDKQGDLASYSNFAGILKLLAPGSSITSTLLNTDFGTKSGTSMAAPHVAGAAAVLKQYWMQAYNKTLTPAQIIVRLSDTGQVVNNGNNDFYLINLLSAIQPSLNIISPMNGSLLNQNEVMIKMISKMPLHNSWIKLKEENLTYDMVKMNDTYFTFNMTNITKSVSYTVNGNNSVGMVGESGLQYLIIETIPPKVVLPFNLTYAKGGLLIVNVNVTDDHSSVKFVTFNVSGDNVSDNYNATKLNSFWVLEINVSKLLEREWLVKLLAVDNRSNFNNTESFILVVDRTPPNLSNLLVSNETFYKNSTVEFKVNASDLNLNEVLIETNLRGSLQNYSMIVVNTSMQNDSNSSNVSNSENNNDNYDNYVYTFNANLSRGNISYTIYVNDLAGNLVDSQINYLNVQNNPPFNLMITSPSNGSSHEVNTIISFTATANDLDDDVLTYSWDFGDGSLANGSSVEHSYSSNVDFVVSLIVSDTFSEINNTLSLVISTPVSNNTPIDNTPDSDSDLDSDDSSSDSTSSGGSSSGGGGSSSQTTSIPPNDNFEFPDIDDFVVEEVKNEIIEETQFEDVIEEVVAEPVVQKESNKFLGGFALVGGAVTQVIGNNKGLGFGAMIVVSLLVTILTVYLVLRKKHEAEIYGIEAVKTLRSNDYVIENKKSDFLKKMNLLKYLSNKWKK